MTMREVLALGAIAVGAAFGSANAAVEAEGFTFDNTAFADVVAGYTVGVPSPNARFQDPAQAVGPFLDPDGEIRGVALGVGGVLTVEFVDNRLIGDGTGGTDLVVFEGGSPEAYFVSISVDGFTFFDLGRAPGSIGEFDVDALIASEGLDPTTQFAFVRIMDDPNQGTTQGSTVGSDITAVGALSSAAVPVPAAAWLFAPALLAAAARRRAAQKRSA